MAVMIIASQHVLLECYRIFIRQTEIFCRTERKSAGQKKKIGFSLSQHSLNASWSVLDILIRCPFIPEAMELMPLD